MKTEIDIILAEVRRRGHYGYKLATDSHKIWVVDSYHRPQSLRCDSVVEAWQSFLSIKLANPDEYAIQQRENKIRRERIGNILKQGLK